MTNQPVQKFSTGAISATIWNNQGTGRNGEPTEFSSITLQRRYNKDGQWQSTNALRLNDLPKASLVLQKAYEFLIFKRADEVAV